MKDEEPIGMKAAGVGRYSYRACILQSRFVLTPPEIFLPTSLEKRKDQNACHDAMHGENVKQPLAQVSQHQLDDPLAIDSRRHQADEQQWSFS